jgi:hypothetical protein
LAERSDFVPACGQANAHLAPTKIRLGSSAS